MSVSYVVSTSTLRRRIPRHDRAGRRHPVRARHPQIHQYDVRPRRLHQRQGLRAVARLADHRRCRRSPRASRSARTAPRDDRRPPAPEYSRNLPRDGARRESIPVPAYRDPARSRPGRYHPTPRPARASRPARSRPAAAVGVNPDPSSRISIHTPPADNPNVISTCVARACFRTFANASCAARNNTTCCACGSAATSSSGRSRRHLYVDARLGREPLGLPPQYLRQRCLRQRNRGERGNQCPRLGQVLPSRVLDRRQPRRGTVATAALQAPPQRSAPASRCSSSPARACRGSRAPSAPARPSHRRCGAPRPARPGPTRVARSVRPVAGSA